MRILRLITMGMMGAMLSSCHFGKSADEIMNKYNNVERDLTFTFEVDQPGGKGTRVSMEDLELSGVRSLWEKADVISLFDYGEVFITTNGGGRKAMSLSYVEPADEDPDDGIDYAVFQGSGLAKMGDEVYNSKKFGLTYPAARFGDLSCSSTTANLLFDGQDGTLFTIGKLYQYAWGRATGICQDGVVTLYEDQADCSSHLDWHPHALGSDRIILDNKMCVIRFSMVCAKPVPGTNDSTWMTLQTYLTSQNLEIASIDVANLDSPEPGIGETCLDLKTGEVTPVAGADTFLTVLPKEPLKEIMEENATPDSFDADAKRVAWGTTFYLAVPCPTSTKLEIRPLLTVKTRSAADHHTAGPTYFGLLQTKTVKEGDYYMTAPVRMVDDMTRLVEETKIYLCYHSSFVWDLPIDVY